MSDCWLEVCMHLKGPPTSQINKDFRWVFFDFRANFDLWHKITPNCMFFMNPFPIIISKFSPECCCILRGPGGERILDNVPGGTELELQLRRGVGKAAHTRNNPHVKCVGAY